MIEDGAIEVNATMGPEPIAEPTAAPFADPTAAELADTEAQAVIQAVEPILQKCKRKSYQT